MKREPHTVCGSRLISILSAEDDVRLFAENKNSLLASKADFVNLSVSAQKNRGVLRLLLAVFPAAIAFSHGIPALLDRGFIPVEGKPVFTCLQRSFPDFCSLCEIDRLCKRLCKSRHGHCQSNKERRNAIRRIDFHACHLFPFAQQKMSRRGWRSKTVDTRSRCE